MDRTWMKRRVIAILLLVPAYLLGYVASRFIPFLFPSLDWNLISPYTVGAIASTIFNTVMWDRWVSLVYRFGGQEKGVNNDSLSKSR